MELIIRVSRYRVSEICSNTYVLMLGKYLLFSVR